MGAAAVNAFERLGRISVQNETGTPSRSALVVEGGALRGIFSTGVLDGFLENGFNPFDFYLGVSSGATNIAAFLAEMIGRNRKVYLDYSLRPEFINFKRFCLGGHLLDLDWLWEITIREIRLDLKTLYSKQKPFYVVMTDVRSGKAVYKETGPDNLEHVLKASSALPVFYRGFPEVDGRPMADGGLADALPVGEAVRMGARRIMVIRSRRRDYRKRSDFSESVLFRCMRRHPRLQEAIRTRAGHYNRSVGLIRQPPPGLSFTEIFPPDDFRVSRLTRDPALLQRGYDQGRSAAEAAIASWNDP